MKKSFKTLAAILSVIALASSFSPVSAQNPRHPGRIRSRTEEQQEQEKERQERAKKRQKQAEERDQRAKRREEMKKWRTAWESKRLEHSTNPKEFEKKRVEEWKNYLEEWSKLPQEELEHTTEYKTHLKKLLDNSESVPIALYLSVSYEPIPLKTPESKTLESLQKMKDLEKKLFPAFRDDYTLDKFKLALCFCDCMLQQKDGRVFNFYDFIGYLCYFYPEIPKISKMLAVLESYPIDKSYIIKVSYYKNELFISFGYDTEEEDNFILRLEEGKGNCQLNLKKIGETVKV